MDNCIKIGRLLPWGPLDTIHLLDSEKVKMEELFDEFGNNYFDYIDEERLREIMDNMKREVCSDYSLVLIKFWIVFMMSNILENGKFKEF